MKSFMIVYKRENDNVITEVPTMEYDFYGAVKTSKMIKNYLKRVHRVDIEILSIVCKSVLQS